MRSHRHAGVTWSLSETGKGPGKNEYGYGTIHAALLMDIRDELQQLNALLSCRNFTNIPATLRAIKTNTTKRRRK